MPHASTWKRSPRPPLTSLVGALVGLWLLAGPAAALDPSNSKSWKVPLADLYAVDTDGEAAWAVGYWGTILRSTDSGATWNGVDTPTERNLFAVDFFDGRNGWAVGAQGAILRSTDGGATWSRVVVRVEDEYEGPVTVDVNLFGVSAISPTEVWIVGDLGMILHSVDAKNWERVVVPEPNFFDDELPDRIFNGVTFTSRTNGWIAGEFGTLLRSRDGGMNWSGERVLEGAIPDIYLMGLDAGADGVGYSNGVGGIMVRTTDDGGTWTTVPVPTGAGLFDVARSGDRVLTVGDRGVIFLSKDGGNTWAEPERPVLFNWLQGAIITNGHAIIVGERSTILHSSDSGDTFSRAVIESPLPARAARTTTPDPPGLFPSGRGTEPPPHPGPADPGR